MNVFLRQTAQAFSGACSIPGLLAGLLLGPALGHTAQAEVQQAPYSFEQLLQDSDLVMRQPPGFEVLPGEDNPVLSYEYALKHPQKKLMVRYAIRPIAMVQIDYEDPHNAAPEANHLFPMLFQTLISDFSSGGASPSREYSPKDARQKYNADWAAVAVMDVTPKFSPNYTQILLLALHKNFAADAYVMLLFDDYQAVKPEIDAILTDSLKFRPGDPATDTSVTPAPGAPTSSEAK